MATTSGTDDEVLTLGELLVRMRSAGTEERVSVGEVVAAIGRRSFGPLLLAPSFVIVTPLSGIPGLPTICATLVVLISSQMLVGRRHLWLPRVLMQRKIDRQRLARALEVLGPAVGRADRFVRPRLAFLTRGPFAYAIAAVCLLIGLMIPPMEVVPLSSSIGALVICLFALGLSTHDGLLVLIGAALLGGGFYFGTEVLVSPG